MIKSLNFLGILFVLVTLTTAIDAWALSDDQRVIRPSEQLMANPPMEKRNFEKINARHKILMGILDSGVDYNQPYLMNNIHTDRKGTEYVTGYDYTGGDQLPYPVIIQTGVHDSRMDDETIRQAMNKSCITSTLLLIEPNLSPWLNPLRDASAEADLMDHGTHVAGLMTYDRPDFGLIPYRILPQNISTDENFGYSKDLSENFSRAIDDMATRGVKIVNYSIRVALSRPVENEDSSKNETLRQNFEKLKTYREKMVQAIQRHPEMLFVAAAGNESQWSDQKSIVGYLCGLELPNILCVGSVNSNGELSSYSNIPLNNVDLIFAIGEKIRSLKASNSCEDAGAFVESLTRYDHCAVPKTFNHSCALPATPMMSADWFVKYLDAFGSDLGEMVKTCQAKGDFTTMSGTSMAAPIVSHLAAEILAECGNTLTPQQIIQKIYERAQPVSLGRLTVSRLSIKKPSWAVRPIVVTDNPFFNPFDVFADRERPQDSEIWDLDFVRTR